MTAAPAPRTPVGGRPPRQPAFNIPPVTAGLAAVLAVFYAALAFGPPALAYTAFRFLTVVPVRLTAAIAEGSVAEAALVLLTLFSHALVHFQGSHFVLNLAFLLAFGSGCEKVLGRRRYVVLVLVSAAAGGIAQIAADWGEVLVMYGASGIVSGCMGGMIRLMQALPQRRRQAWALLIALLAFNGIFAWIGPTLLDLDAKIAWQAHLGGFAAGLLLGYPPSRRQPRRAGGQHP